MKTARRGFGEPFECKQSWPEDCFVQCGESGLVMKKGSLEKTLSSKNPIKTVVENTSYITAFFEAFPKNPNTFIRGEGKTVEEAEEKAYKKFVKYSSCSGHEFESRRYRNGGGFCKHCGMFGSQSIPPVEKCEICGEKTWWHLAEIEEDDIHKHTWCEKCSDEEKVPKEWKKTYDY